MPLFRAGLRAHQKQDHATAVRCYRDALRLDPDHADACNNLGVALRAIGRIEAAVAAYRRALALNPNNAGAHSNLGNALRALGRFGEAEVEHRAALALKPDYVEATYNLGLVFRDQARYQDALVHIEAAIAARPDYVDAQWDRSLALLTLGRLEQGLPAYEWRWRLPESRRRELPAPLWNGAPLAGRTILLHAEQGLGDSLQFIRYVPLVVAKGGRVVLEIQPPLVRLMATLPGGAQ
ncbi:MAG: tetratricopeptide repeat protein, partial [Alphaproteobacteria bacterium]|nr:tetratricopeptide repeat protein [Alphaproteobacteria bacterium]